MSLSIFSTMKSIWAKMRRKGYRDAYVDAHVSNTIASQIGIMRERRGWTQADLAKRAGMKQPRISALEDPNNENVESETLRRLAVAFDVGLSIRFVPFSEIVEWAATLTNDKLDVPSFEEDALRGTATSSSEHVAVGIVGHIEGNPTSGWALENSIILTSDQIPAQSSANDFVRRFSDGFVTVVDAGVRSSGISRIRLLEHEA